MDKLELGLLLQVLTWIVSMGGAGVLVAFAAERWPWFQKLTSEYKRYLSYLFSGSLGVLAYCGLMLLGYVTVPAAPVAWVETLFAVAFVASGASQLFHARTVLRKKGRVVSLS